MMLLSSGPAKAAVQCSAASQTPVHKLLKCVQRRCSVGTQLVPSPAAASHEQLRPRRALTRVQAAPTTQTATSTEGGWWTKDAGPNMKDVDTIQQLVDELADAGDKLVIVEFYAPWCNACRALYPKLCKLMAEHEDDVLFLKISFEANKDVCKTLGVKVLPFFHFYRGGEGRVDQFSCTISKIQRLKDAIELYTAAFCSLEEPPGVIEFPDVHPHADDAEQHPDADRPTCLKTLGWA